VVTAIDGAGTSEEDWLSWWAGGAWPSAPWPVAGRTVVPGDLCLATWRGDGHPDHEAVGRAAARAARFVGATLWEFPVWAWHWARPGAIEVPWHRSMASQSCRRPCNGDSVGRSRWCSDER
jgi:hypothetical protein